MAMPWLWHPHLGPVPVKPPVHNKEPKSFHASSPVMTFMLRVGTRAGGDKRSSEACFHQRAVALHS